jgi:predicted DNA-binding protein (MmcQ/YjbR family)
MTSEELRDQCLSFLGSEEEFPFGPETSVFKVAGKVFALSRLVEIPLRVSLKCDPALAEQLRAAHPAVLPGYHLNKLHWNTVIIDGSLSGTMIADLIEDSYDLVVSKLPRARRRALAWPGDALAPPQRPASRERPASAG